MNKIITLVLSLFMTLFIGTQAFAESGYITTNGVSKIELSPNVVDFDIEIITTSKESMAKAMSENKKISAKVYENLKKTIDKNKDDSLKTTNFSAIPVYKYNGNKRTLEHYQVTNSVKVHTKQISNAGQMIDNAIADGATSVKNISYNISDYDTECNKLLADATKKARAQAECIANALGTQITGIKSVDINCSLANPATSRVYMKSMAVTYDAVETCGTTIEVGTMTLNARVSINFYIK